MLTLSRLIITFIIVIGNIVNSNAEINNPNTFQSDTAHINKHINTSSDLIFINSDSAELYIDSILSLSNKVNYEYGMFSGHNLKGIAFWVNNQLDLALSEYKLALLYSNNLNKPRPKAVVLSNIALLYSNVFNTDSALLYFSKTIQYSKKHDITDILTKALFDIGSMQLHQDNYVDAIKNFSKVKDKLENSNDSALLLSIYISFGQLYSKLDKFNKSLQSYNAAIDIAKKIGKQYYIVNTYLDIGQLYFSHKNELDSAQYYFRKVIETPLPIFKDKVELSAYINLGNYYLNKMQLDTAFTYYQKAFANPSLNNFPAHKAAVLVNLGLYYVKKKNYNKAQYFLDRGYGLSDTLGIVLYKMNAIKGISELDSILGNFKLSHTHYIEYAMLSDSLKSYKAANEIATLEYEKYIEQKKYNNELLRKENYIKSKMIWISTGVVVVLLFLLFILYLNRTRIKHLNTQLSKKHNDLQILNEELVVTNENLVAYQSKLKEVNVSKDKFFSMLGHDLKSPFNGLLGMLNLIVDDWENISDIEKKDMLQSLLMSSQKTYGLLENMLSWSKTQQGQIKYNPELFTVYTKINEITTLLKAQIESKKQELKIDISPELKIESDIHLFSQIIQNLLNNAIKFTPVGGNITIRAEQNNKKIKICIIDNGIGIPKNKISKILNLDSDFNRPGTVGEKSSGMGLLLSNEYAKIINAQLEVSSTDTKGSSFCLVINNDYKHLTSR